jgi:GNAT superfamily N-acetyltransferase
MFIFENYRNDPNLINKYFDFIGQVFQGISFNQWYKKGFWTEQYIPFSIMESDKIISNVSAAFLNIIIQDKLYKAVQLGAVGTLPEYRNRGLSAYLMNYVIDKYKESVDFFFLYANETVLKFYPQFGFRELKEKIFIQESEIPRSDYCAVKLNITKDKDYQLIFNLIKERKNLTRISGAEDYSYITMWHIFNTYPENLYYIGEEDVLIIKDEKNNILNIREIIFREAFNLKKTLSGIMESPEIEYIHYHFPPDQIGYHYDKIINETSHLFILGKLELNNQLIKFPVTLQT